MSAKFREILGILIVFGLLVTGMIVIGTRLSGDTTQPEDSGAIYGGSLESGYPYAGYMIAFKSEGSISICSTTFLSPTVGISAAHCIFRNAEMYVGTGQFTLNTKANYLPAKITTKSGWDGKTSKDDLSLVILDSRNKPVMTEFAEITSPTVGCNYLVVGYGSTELDGTTLNPDRPRKSAQVCITDMDADVIRLQGQGGGLCFGDSGSPVFESGTNKLVAVISAITAGPGESKASCHIDNRAVAVRVDSNIDFINTADPDDTSFETVNAECGNSCETLGCGTGLTCTSEKICEIDGRSSSTTPNSCVAEDNSYCSDRDGITCAEGSQCILNSCRNFAPAAATDNSIGDLASGILQQLGSNATFLFWIVAAAAIFVFVLLMLVVLSK